MESPTVWRRRGDSQVIALDEQVCSNDRFEVTGATTDKSITELSFEAK